MIRCGIGIPEDFESIEAAAESGHSQLGRLLGRHSTIDRKSILQRSTILLPLEQGIAKRLSEAAQRRGMSDNTGQSLVE